MAKGTAVKIAYIGGGSRGWARTLMADLAREDEILADISLYDIDYEAAKSNEKIGNALALREDVKGKHHYHAEKTLGEALTGADFVIISVLPATFDEMESDVHEPEKYGIYQSVGDTSGPGGLVRAMRTLPLFKTFAEGIRDYCPNAWVINYTNPMTMCTKALYEVFPKIKAFGCCHEVFGTEDLIAEAFEEQTGEKITHRDMKISVAGVNHFTWITEARYKNYDLKEIYSHFADKYYESGYMNKGEQNWMNNCFLCGHRVKFDLYKRYGAIAAAGDRHLAEFCPGSWYLKDPETVRRWQFGLTPVSWRKEDLKNRIAKTERLLSGEEELSIKWSGEEGVAQIKAIMGLSEIVTNCNLPNVGQMKGIPEGAVVETNAVFSADSVKPVVANELPEGAQALVARISAEQELAVKAILSEDYDTLFAAFVNDPLVTISPSDAWELYLKMIENTKAYIPGAEKFLAKYGR